MFEDVFQDSLAAEFVKMSDSKPQEIWAEMDNAFTTVTLKKSASAVREFTNFNRKPGEVRRQFILRVEGARKTLNDVYVQAEITNPLPGALIQQYDESSQGTIV